MADTAKGLKAKGLKPRILITCEHADFQIPSFISSPLPKDLKALLKTHHSFDKGALEISKKLQKNLNSLGVSTDLIFYPYTRLILDANRSPGEKGHYSKIAKHLSQSELQKMDEVYFKYRQSCLKWVNRYLNTHSIFLFSIHSFTPVYQGKVRPTDIGLLFRNKIPKELKLANLLKKELSLYLGDTKVHKNLPYRGHTDCFTNSILDTHLANKNVNGLFFEFNQGFLQKNSQKTADALSATLRQILSED